jgi:hypothetical protein
MEENIMLQKKQWLTINDVHYCVNGSLLVQFYPTNTRCVFVMS